MANKYRIAVLGIGGVGGFLGGKLAAAFGDSSHAEVIFLARGANAKAIKENGLKLIIPMGQMTVRPEVADYISFSGDIDLLICCTKAYDLEDSIKALSPYITPKTVILPLLNGVDNTEKVQALVPEAKVLQGCIYVVSKLIEPGVVQQRGDFYSLHFGGPDELYAELGMLKYLLEQANVTMVQEDNIYEKIWSKFSFISPLATYTSAHNISIGKILESEEHSAAVKKLMNELLILANAMSVGLPADTVENNFAVMAKQPYEATSSMQADFANNKQTELETLTGYVVKKAAEHGLQLDEYNSLYALLKERQKG